MKHLFILFGLFSALQSYSQKSLLWEITGNGLEHPSYVFGTMHIMPKKDFHINKIVKEKLLASDQIIFEVNMFDMGLKEQLKLARKMFLTNGTVLNDYVGEEQYRSILSFAKDTLGISEKKFEKRYNRLTPFALNSVFVAEYIGKHKMFEKEFHKMAKRKKKEIGELETIEFQMSLVTEMSVETQIEYFLDVSEMYEINRMITLYINQDLQAIYELSMEDLEEDEKMADFMKSFLDDRNADWIPKIEAQIKEKSCFIAVGAAHLPGKYGVLELLRKQGYQVKAVQN